MNDLISPPPVKRPVQLETLSDSTELATQFRERLGMGSGQMWIVHSSMRSLGPIEGGPGAVIHALQSTVGPTGLIVMPTFSDPSPDRRFDPRSTPSRTGLITETFRRSPDVVRSRHPTHSVCAWGARARAFLEGHETTAPLGRGSPLHQLALAGARVLMIGCGLTTASVLHVAEDLAVVPYLGRVWYPTYDEPIECVEADGSVWTYKPCRVPGDSSQFGKLKAGLREHANLIECRIGQAPCLTFDAQAALAYTAERLREDPLLLLCDSPRCEYCAPARRLPVG